MELHKQDALNFYTWANVKWPPVFEREQELYTMPRESGPGLDYTELTGRSVLLKHFIRLESKSSSVHDLS